VTARARVALALCLASTLLGCETEDVRSGSEVTDGAGEGGAAGEGGSDADGLPTANASYQVPVADEELEPWATYPIPRVRFEVENGRVRIGYGFPRWLTGVGGGIELEGEYSGEPTRFDVTVKDVGTGTCTRFDRRFDCYEVLPGLSVDRERAAEEMHEDGLAADEIEQRLRVTDSFSTDPIGILSFDLL
jgi:hypothetical protein